LIVVDVTHPTAVNANARLYTEVGVDFVIGTTGGDREALQKTAEEGGVYTVIAPTMNKQVLALQATIAKMSEDFPSLFEGFTLELTESHQKTKKDKSAVGQEMINSFVQMGAKCPEGNIHQIRDDEKAQEFGVPKESLTGHAFHRYSLTTADGSSGFKFEHNLQGNAGAASGALDAVQFLLAMKNDGSAKKNFNMMDVVCSKQVKRDTVKSDAHPGSQV